MRIMLLPMVILATSGSFGQSPQFEVASIKPSAYPGGNLKTIRVDPGMITIKGMSLQDLIQRAYGRGHALQLSRSDLVAGGPKWCDTDLYDIEAKPGGNPNGSGEQISEMLQALLVERFKLAIHHEVKETSGYRLIVGKNGPRVRERSSGDGGELRTGSSRRIPEGFHVMRRDTSMTAFADYLGFNVLDRPVIDRSGLLGTFDFDLSWNPDETQFAGRYGVEGSNLPNLFAALREQLGLGLETGQVPVDVIVIDHAAKPSDN